MFMTYDKNFFSKNFFLFILYFYSWMDLTESVYISRKKRDSFYRIETIIIEDDVLLPDDGKYQLSFGLLF